jgi:hypothetical protein
VLELEPFMMLKANSTAPRLVAHAMESTNRSAQGLENQWPHSEVAASTTFCTVIPKCS